MRKCISLLTDFDLRDAYVGMVKGAILSVNPDVQIIDICHAIPPQDIIMGAFHIG
ncbi:MAG: hypothetical protein EOM18_17115, partial [Clostridia bacterium]|nr:hypothetical protein [Clostridia bacterium]